MAENEEKPTEAAAPPPKGKPDKGSGSSNADVKLQENIELSMKLPIPSKNDFWVLEAAPGFSLGKKGLLSLLKKKDLTEDEIGALRMESEKAPGQARVKIQTMMKKYSASASLISLSALCSYKMVKNSSDRKFVLEGLKNASKEAATALINDGISLYNVETFFNIYFDYLGKLKRFQIATYKAVGESGKFLASKKTLATAIKMCDSMLEDKNRAFKVLSQIKGKFKSSTYVSLWHFAHIQMAAKKVEQNEFKAVCGPAQAREILVYTLALTEIFARIQFMGPMVEKILAFVPESTTSFYLRKSAIVVSRAFAQLNVAVQEGDMERMRNMGRQIYKTTMDNINRLGQQPIKQSFEADPFFQLTRMAILTFGSYEAKEQKDILLKSIAAMNKVVKIDMTKNHIYTATAQDLITKLHNLMSE